MPTDFHQLFSALGDHAESVPLGGPDLARRRGRERGRNRLIATVAASLVLVTVATMATVLGVRVLRDGLRPAPPARPDQLATEPTGLHGLKPFGKGVPMDLGTGAAHGFGMASIIGDRAYVAAHADNGTLAVGAIDLTTGNPAWSTRDLGKWGDWNGFQAYPQGLIVIGEHDDGSKPDHVGIVLDPATGQKRWQTNFDSLSLEPFESVLAVSEAGVIRGLDWRTGAEKWRVQSGAVELLSDVRTDSSGGPVAHTPGAGDVLAIDSEGTLRRYDSSNGKLRATRPNVGAPARNVSQRISEWPEYAAFDGTLYTITREPTRLTAYDLSGSTPPRLIIEGDPSMALATVWPCGAALVCLIGSPSQDSELIVVDVARQRVRWRVTGNRSTSASAFGDRILTNSAQLFDLDGKSLAGDGGGLAGPVSPGRALVISHRLDRPTEELQISGMSLVDGERTVLGSIRGGPGLCEWSTTVLVCPTPTGFSAWRFSIG
jgi:outer membrane protein assembly factor BamB